MPSTLASATPAVMIRDYVIAEGRDVLFNGWTFKFGKLPPEPDQLICLIDQGGPTSFPNLLVDYLGLQIIVRSVRAMDGYLSSYLMIRKIRDIILGMDPHPVEFRELDGVTERGNIVPMGYDDQDRHMWSANFQLLVEPEANALTHRVSL